MLRRAPEAVIAAHILDPARRELFVEGARDRVFLLWLVGSDRDSNARVAEIDEVDIPQIVQGGRRARLFTFAAFANQEPAQIRFFADADMARIDDHDIPKNIWITDLRDLEGYIFRAECIDKALHLGVGVGDLDATAIVLSVARLARRLAALRLLSHRERLNLPFQRLNLERYVAVRDGEIQVDFDRVLRALIQTAGLSLSGFDDLKRRWEAEEEALYGIADAQLLHGKDVLCLVGEILVAYGITRADAEKLIWTSFERWMVDDHPVLGEVVDFLRAA